MITYTNYDNTETDVFSENDEWQYVAKKAVTDKLKRFFIRMNGSYPIDCRNLSKYEVRNMIHSKFKEVTEDVYNKYITYLSGKTYISVKSLERLING